MIALFVLAIMMTSLSLCIDNNMITVLIKFEMYHLCNHQQLIIFQAATKRKVDERLTLCLNEDLHSPLTLAAAVPAVEDSDTKRKMLEFLLKQLREKRWTFGPVEVC